MQKKLKSLSEIKKELKIYLKDKEVYDVVLFGSFVKGKINPNDLDVAIISDKILEEVEEFHISFIKPQDFFINIPSLVSTLFKEGFSLKHNRSFSEIYGFKNRVLFSYDLSSEKKSKKVKIVNFLRGRGEVGGLVQDQGGDWLGNGIFIIGLDKDYLFEQFFLNNKIKFKKSYLLMH